MKILNFGTDNSILDSSSILAERIREYSMLVDRYDVVVTNKSNLSIDLSSKVKVEGVKADNKIIGLFRFFRAANKLLKQEKYDIITVQDQYYIALIGLILGRRFGAGVHIQIHGWEKFGGLRALIAKFVLPRADAIRTVSERLKRQLVNEFGVNAEKITVVPMHVRISNSGRKKLGMQNEKSNFIFFTIGRLVPVKNIQLQIEAMKEIADKFNQQNNNLELWIVGEGKGKPELEMLIKKYSLDDKVKLLGWKNRSELENIFGQVDAFLLTSYSEGWPIVIIEAASFGLPIIMTDVGSAGEFIKNGENGIVIPINDEEKLVSAMLEVYQNKELRDRLGGNAYQSVLGLPPYEKILRLYLESWKKAAKK
jgi:glycosyltransferase involved in cell wall biosynthesis